MSILFISYMTTIVIPYLRYRPTPTGDPHAFTWHFLVPCRDEEAVITHTIHYLRETFPQCHVWVIDDASDDQTAELVRSQQRNGGDVDGHIHLVERVRPDARIGKGPALNAAYRELKRFLGDADPARQLVAVVDADGRPSPNNFEVCSGPTMFGDPKVGAVQVDVHMMNRGIPKPGTKGLRKWFGLYMARMQDLEFRTALCAIQLARKYTGTIAMGGNGQYTRMSALNSIAGDTDSPWGGSLLEDFELGVHLLIAGWKTTHSRDAWVSQEAVYSLRRFLTQRTRWGQGTMQCWRYLPVIWNSRHVSTMGATEMMYYLMQPWMQLVGTLIFPIPFVVIGVHAVENPADTWLWFTSGAWVLFVMYLVFGMLPFVIWGPIYWRRCERDIGPLRGIMLGLGYWLYVYNFYLTSWRAVYRIIRGRNGWAKTRRNKEIVAKGAAVALES
ncbi:glycosyltransferase [Pseudonocardiaceae bacterium YIM PH 21723]|nr:glycosyltransferase [Pseudonocardiaceae bacterium YIM PH 21723]